MIDDAAARDLKSKNYSIIASKDFMIRNGLDANYFFMSIVIR